MTVALGHNLTAHIAHGLSAVIQPKTVTVFFGGETMIEQPPKVLLANAHPRIAYTQYGNAFLAFPRRFPPSPPQLSRP